MIQQCPVLKKNPLNNLGKQLDTLSAMDSVINELKGQLLKELDEPQQPIVTNGNCICPKCPCACHRSRTGAPDRTRTAAPDLEPPEMLLYLINTLPTNELGEKINKSKLQTSKPTKRGDLTPVDEEEDVIRVRQSKSRELRGGIMYVGCDCEKRNGLQDDCRRTECHGSPECLTKPKPTCGPSEFCDAKHLAKKYGKRKRMPRIPSFSHPRYECDSCEQPPLS